MWVYTPYIELIKLWYFTNLAFPEIAGDFPLLNHVFEVAIIWPYIDPMVTSDLVNLKLWTQKPNL